MLIGIDASRPNEAQKTGTEWYAYHIIQEIKKLDRTNRFVLYSIDPLRGGLEKLSPNFSSRVLRSVTDILWTQLRLSVEMLTSPPDVLFVPAHTIPLVHPKATVLTVHDLGFEHFPELYKQTPIGPEYPLFRGVLNIGARVATLGTYGNSEYDYHRWAMRFGVARATRIIAISIFTKNDVVKRYHADPDKITVIPHGFESTSYRPIRPDETMHNKTFLKLRPYVLFVGRVEKKKNIDGLLTAYRLFKRQARRPHRLVLVGKPGLGIDAFRRTIEHFPSSVKKDIHLLGWLPEHDVVDLYRHADLFVFPSYFEGFGIPIIQAMACGVPVVCSNTTALPEVAGNAAILVDPSDPPAIARAMTAAVDNRQLRHTLIRRGIVRANTFSWNASAKATLRVINEAYEAVHRKAR